MKPSVETRSRIAFVVTLLVLAVGGLVWYFATGAQYTRYEIRSRDAVSGLIPGAPVEFHGVEVGRVHEVKLADPGTARIVVEVSKDAPVSSATVATLTGRGLAARGFTGYVYISLDDRGPPGQPLRAAEGQRYAQIATAPSQLSNIDQAVSQMNETVRVLGAQLQVLLDPATVASLKQSLGDVNKFSRALEAHNQRLASILANAEKASAQMPPLLQASSDAVRTMQTQVLPQARQAMANLDQLSQTTQQRMGAILQNTEQASARFEPLLAASNETVRSLQQQVLPQAYRTLTRLDQLSLSLDETATLIRRNPSALLRGNGPAPLGPGETP